jgi:signal transduction histidine kinase
MIAEHPSLVLVADDHDAGRFVKVQTLRRAGFEVREAATGLAALEMAMLLKPDVVILDVNLPDVSGIEVCRRLRAVPDVLPALQVLQISNTAITTADRVRGLEGGADVYLTEPVEGEILIATVRALVRARRAELALAVALEREREARSVAEEASRLKDEFIATLSHELRTPLNALMGWIWQLRHSTLDEGAQRRALDSLERNARVQAQLINDLLDISRISKGKLHLTIQLVDLQAVVDAAVESVRDSAAHKHLVLTIASRAPSCVAGDQARLQQVVTNLLTNAVQFTPEHGEISIALKVDRENAVITVTDTGEGIDPAFLPHVFDQFRQGEAGLSRKHGGLGLGLSVVRQMVDLHGGEVSVSSEGRGHGTTFTVRLPRELDVKHGDTAAPVLTGVHVLIAHPVGGDLAEILRASGAQATVAASPPGVDAQAEFDVAIADAASVGTLPPGAPVVVIDRALNAADLVRRVMHALPASSKASHPA